MDLLRRSAAAVAGGSLAERPGRLVPALLLIVVAVLLGAGFAGVERRVAGPLVPSSAMRHPRLRTGTAGSFLNTATTGSAMALVTLAYRRAEAAALPEGSGFLVPPVDGRTIKASTFASRKWGWIADEDPDVLVVRTSVGRYGEKPVSVADASSRSSTNCILRLTA